MYRWKIVLDFWPVSATGDRQPEISICLPKPEIITYLELWQIASKFQRQIPDFSIMFSSTEDYPNDCDNDRQPEVARLASKTSILQFPVVGRCHNRRDRFLRAGRGRKSLIVSASGDTLQLPRWPL